MKNSFSVWLELPNSLKTEIQPLCDSLSEAYGGPKFEAHITLSSSLAGDQKQVTEKLANVLADIEPFSLSTLDVACSVTYFQSVYLRISPTAELLKLNMKVREAFSLEPVLFMPHISLFYGGDEIDTRLEIASQIDLQKSDFEVDTLLLTPSVSDPKDWKHLAEFSLNT